VLLIGGGTGRILPALFQRTACDQVVFLEASGKMVAKARSLAERQPYAGKVTFRVGTEEDIGPQERFDVILTFFFLDLFSPPLLYPIASRLFQALKPQGWWLASDFVRPRGAWRRVGAELLFRSMYLFFRVTCGISATSLPDWQALLARFPLTPVKSCYFYHGLVRATAYQKREA
jgi:SAM-dependent methyltransferase